MWSEWSGGRLTSEAPWGAPAILLSPDSIGLSEAMVGAASSYSPPRGIVYVYGWFCIWGCGVFGGCQVSFIQGGLIAATCWEALVGLETNCACTSL